LRLCSLCFIVPLLSGLLSAQSAPLSPPQTDPLIHTNARAVSVDVVASDKSGQPIGNLARQDFQILEDGKPQPIDLFEEHTAQASTPDAAPLQLPPNVYSNQPAAPQGDAVSILLLDSLNTPEADQAYVHKQIRSFVETMQPGTRLAIFTLNQRLRLLQGFTADPAQLRAALDSKAAAPEATSISRTREDDLRDKEEVAIVAEMSGNSDNHLEAAAKAHARTLEDQAGTQAGQHTTETLAALSQLARAMAAVPGRKNLIWFAGTFPVSIYPNGPERQTLANGKEMGEAIRQTAALLTAARVALYPVSAQGILVDSTTNADSAGQPLGDDSEKNPNQGAAANSANSGAMLELAADTGGRAFYKSNDLSQAVASAIQSGSHYYTLVYTPPAVQLDGKFHRIEVRLIAGKASLAYRRGYYADSAASETKAASIADPLPPLLANGLPASTQILYQARVLPLASQPAPDPARAGGNGKLSGPLTRYKVDLIINPSTVKLDLAPDLTHSGKIEVALIAYDPAGKPVNWAGETLGITLNAASYAQVERIGIPVHLQLDLPDANLSLATGVYDLNAHKAGTLEIPLVTKAAQ
jgi:VWFA-related protein